MNGFRFSSCFLSVIFAIISFPFLNGCNAPKDQLNIFNEHFTACDYENSVLFAKNKVIQRDIPKGEDLLWTLQLASVERIRQNYQMSTEYFDSSEDMLKYYDEQSTLGDALGSTIVNDNLAAYKGQEYDGVMINTYKALNFMSLGEMDLARVEFNRALDRQRRAKEKFNVEINKLKSELEEKEQQGDENIRANIENPQTAELLTAKYPSLYTFQAYPDFVNPFATYLAGIYFNLVGDPSKGVYLLKESYGMVSDNVYIAEDLNITEDVLDGKRQFENTVWVIFENGLGPVKEEFRLDIPLFVVTDKIKYVGIALPRLKFRDSAYPYLIVEANGKNYNTSLVSDMDRVVQTEFSKDYKGILTRAIISATAKAVAQYEIEKQGDSTASFMSIVAAAYSFVTTAADVRIWTALPKEFQIARFAKPENNKLKITPPGSAPFEVNIPACNNAIVYVKITTNLAEPIYEVIGF